MDIEYFQNLCKKLPSVTEDIKWGNDLCFCIGGKMFCAVSLTKPMTVAFKVKDEEFDELSNRIGIIPAPYAARHKWIMIIELNIFSKKEWDTYITQSFDLVKSKFSKKFIKRAWL